MQAGKRQREKMIELIRQLGEDDKDGVMVEKVSRRLELFKSFFCCLVVPALLSAWWLVYAVV